MSTQHVPSYCLFSVLCGITLQNRLGKEGENFTVGCSYMLAANNKKYFCKGSCAGEDILIETELTSYQNGRYSIEDKRTGVFYVTIAELKKSDAGTYWCGVERLLKNTHTQINIGVDNASTLRPTSIVPFDSTIISSAASNYSGEFSTSFTTLSSSSTVRTTGPWTSAYNTHDSSGLMLYVSVGLVVMATAFGLALLMLYRKRAGKPPESSNPDYAPVTEADCVYEEIREDDRPTDRPLELRTVHSSVTAPAGPPDDSDSALYSELDPPRDTTVNSGPRTVNSVTAVAGDSDDLIYSMAQLPKDVVTAREV